MKKVYAGADEPEMGAEARELLDRRRTESERIAFKFFQHETDLALRERGRSYHVAAKMGR